MIAHLALAPGGAADRGRLSGLLWSESADAKASLRQCIRETRQAFAAAELALLGADRFRVALDVGALWVDVLEVERLGRSEVCSDLEEMATLYQGDLLEELPVRDPAFDEWLVVERPGCGLWSATLSSAGSGGASRSPTARDWRASPRRCSASSQRMRKRIAPSSVITASGVMSQPRSVSTKRAAMRWQGHSTSSRLPRRRPCCAECAAVSTPAGHSVAAAWSGRAGEPAQAPDHAHDRAQGAGAGRPCRRGLGRGSGGGTPGGPRTRPLAVGARPRHLATGPGVQPRTG